MNISSLLPYIYGFIPGALLGAVFGVLWSRKHPKTVEAAVQAAKSKN